jgi:acetyltransferase-like isoleucine patch superfamily enzyme
MIGILRSVWMAAVLYVLRRRQHDNDRLRRLFRERYDIDVGYYSYGCFDRWRMPGPMTVGRYCSIAGTVRVAPRNHPTSALTTHPVLYEPQFGLVDADLPPAERLTIEDDVWIGHNVVILPGCKSIGRGAVIGAGAVVTRNVAPYSIVAGNPARPIRQRFSPDLIVRIEASRWWELDVAGLRALRDRMPDILEAPTAEALERLFPEP